MIKKGCVPLVQMSTMDFSAFSQHDSVSWSDVLGQIKNYYPIYSNVWVARGGVGFVLCIPTRQNPVPLQKRLLGLRMEPTSVARDPNTQNDNLKPS